MTPHQAKSRIATLHKEWKKGALSKRRFIEMRLRIVGKMKEEEKQVKDY